LGLVDQVDVAQGSVKLGEPVFRELHAGGRHDADDSVARPIHSVVVPAPQGDEVRNDVHREASRACNGVVTAAAAMT
jgi:hypothetical protein